jgi:hypothetical protein
MQFSTLFSAFLGLVAYSSATTDQSFLQADDFMENQFKVNFYADAACQDLRESSGLPEGCTQLLAFSLRIEETKQGSGYCGRKFTVLPHSETQIGS